MAGFAAWLRGVFRTKDGPDPGPGLPHGRTRPSGPESFAEDNNDFALSMYGQLQQRPGNLFFSPFSIRTALGMTEAGARGETAAQMRVALSISSSDETLHVASAEIIQRLNAAGGGKYEMAVANSLLGARRRAAAARIPRPDRRALWRQHEPRRFPPRCRSGSPEDQRMGRRKNEAEDPGTHPSKEPGR